MQLNLQEDYNFVEVLWVLLVIVNCCQCVCVIRNVYVLADQWHQALRICFFLLRRCCRTVNLVLALHVLDQVDDAVGVTELVVVPGDELDEGVAQLDSGLGVKDG